MIIGVFVFVSLAKFRYGNKAAWLKNTRHFLRAPNWWKFLRSSLYMLTFYFWLVVFRTRECIGASIMVVGELELSRFLFSDPRLAQNPCKNSTTKIVKVNFMEPERDIERIHIHDDVAWKWNLFALIRLRGNRLGIWSAGGKHRKLASCLRDALEHLLKLLHPAAVVIFQSTHTKVCHQHPAQQTQSVCDLNIVYTH